jgi:SanA protein
VSCFWRTVALIAAIGAAIEVALVGLVFYTEGVERPLEKRDAVIVLGARVMPDGEMSTTLLHRVQTALEVYRGGHAKLIIACGAQGRDEPESEAGAMARWLVERGVPAADVVVEDRSTDTIENLKNARALMEARGLKTAIIVTSDYHVTRALWLARDQGLDAIGASAPGNITWGQRMSSRFRESLSWINYFLGGYLKPLVFWR